MSGGQSHEERRLLAIEQLQLLDRIGDPALTALTRLASFVTGARSAAVHILDDRYQRRIAATGAPLMEHPLADSMCLAVLEDGEPIVCFDATEETRFTYSSFVSGEDAVRFYASVPLRTSEGYVVGTVCAFDTDALHLSDEQLERLEDIAEQARAHIELVRIAMRLGEAAVRDPLTGAINRVMFDDRLAQALRRRQRHGTFVLVAVLDVDDFKAINDAEGHERGDEVLVDTVVRLKSALRAEDTVGRLGGDEFGVIVELADPDQAKAVLERLREVASGSAGAPSVSLGAAFAKHEDDVRSALQRADEAMFAAKRARTG